MNPVRETVLDNGLTLLIRENHAAPVVSCWAGYRVGARNERPGITGASHWVEHMTFKGTRGLAKGDIFRLTARYGGSNNGFTSDDTTIYYETLPAAQLDLGLRIEAERMAHALFDPEETERERTVILAERDGVENNPHYRLSERMGETAFRVHPYRWPVIGTRTDLERMTRDELLAHYRTYYAPNNAVVVIVGDLQADEALAAARRHFDAIPPGPPPPPVEAVEPPQEEPRCVEERRPTGNPYLQVSFRTPAFGHPDTYPLSMLDAVMSGGRAISWSGAGYMGRTARLYRALVETRLATSAGTGFRFMMDPYAFGASLTVREDASPEQAQEALLAALDTVAREPPKPEELERVLRQTEALLAYGRDGVTGQAYALLFFHLLSHWSDMDHHLERLRAVRPDDVARVAAEYLREENRTLGWLLPDAGVVSGRSSVVSGQSSAVSGQLGTAPSAAVSSSSSSSVVLETAGLPDSAGGAGFRLRQEPRREELSNGMVLLWSRNLESEAVAVRGSFPAGSAREAAGKEGLAAFTARLLRRGTARRGAQEIAEAVESVGASFSVWGGAEEAGFSAKCLGKDLPRVLEVLREVLEEPAFEESEIAKTRGEVLGHLREQEDSTRAQAERAILAALYPPGHPYSRFAVGTRESVEGLRREDLQAFHAAYYGAAGMKVSVVGNFEADAVRPLLEGWFAGKPSPPPLPDWRVSPSGVPTEARLPMPHKSQVDIIIAGPGIPRDHPDFFALSLVNLILGSLGLMGRLGERVREQQGMAYYASCRSGSRLWAGEWMASAGVTPENVAPAMEAILAEVERIRREPVTEIELQDARDNLIGSLPLRLETNDGVAGYLLNSEYYGLGLDYIERYPGYILRETRESLMEAARRHMDPARFSVAMAGPV